MKDIPISITDLGGGLNTGILSPDDTDASDLSNIDFDKYGSIKKRLGYYPLNRIFIGSSTGLDFNTNEIPGIGLNWVYTIGSTTV